MHVSLGSPPGPIEYPESDGKPMADNSVQFRWIFVLAGNLQALFKDDPNVFVCGNQNWYPVKGEPEVVNAPDVYVVFGRPKGERRSWKQWEEDNVPMTVVFEVLSPNNTDQEMDDNRHFYEEHGVEEYYLYDPDKNKLEAYHRQGTAMGRVREKVHFHSPRLGINFDLSGPEMVVRYPNGEPFLTFEETKTLQERDRQRAEQAEQRAQQDRLRAAEAERLADQERQQAEAARRQAEQERQRAAEAERLAGEERQRAEAARQQAEQERRRAEQAEQHAEQQRQRTARMQELSGKLLRGEASPEEIQELQRLLS